MYIILKNNNKKYIYMCVHTTCMYTPTLGWENRTLLLGQNFFSHVYIGSLTYGPAGARSFFTHTVDLSCSQPLIAQRDY